MNALGSSMSGLTLVERQAKLAREKKEKEEKDRQAFDFDSWGMGAGTTSSRPSGVPGSMAIPAPSKAAALLQPVPRKPEAPIKATSAKDDWGFDDLLGGSSKSATAIKVPPTPSSRATSAAPTDPWDLDALTSQSAKPSDRKDVASRNESHERGSSWQNDDEDNLLGDLGRPAQKPRAERPPIPPKVSRSITVQSTSIYCF